MEYLYFVQFKLNSFRYGGKVQIHFVGNITVVALCIQVIFTGDHHKVYLLLQTYNHIYFF